MYRDQLVVNKPSFAEKMAVSLLCNTVEHQSAIFVFLCVFLTSATGASSVWSSTLITRSRCTTVWHNRRIRVVKSLSYRSQPLGVKTFHKGQTFPQISGPSIILTWTLSSFCLPSTLSPLCSSDLPVPFLFSRSCLFRFFHLCLASPRIPAVSVHSSDISHLSPQNQLVGAAWVLQTPAGHVVAHPAAATADAGAAAGAGAAWAAEAAGRAVLADQRRPDAHR